MYNPVRPSREIGRLQRVQLGVFALEVVGEVVGVEGAAAEAFHQPLGLLHAAPLPDTLLEGGLQRLHVAAGPLGVKIMGLAQVINGLCAVGTAQRIAGEVADVAHRPVDAPVRL